MCGSWHPQKLPRRGDAAVATLVRGEKELGQRQRCGLRAGVIASTAPSTLGLQWQLRCNSYTAVRCCTALQDSLDTGGLGQLAVHIPTLCRCALHTAGVDSGHPAVGAVKPRPAQC